VGAWHFGLSRRVEGGRHEVKRILFILPALDLGGMEIVVMNYFREINRAEMVFDFVVHKSGGYFEEEAQSLGARIFRVPTRGESFFGSMAAMRKLYREHPEYDTVVVCTEHAFAFLEMYAAWRGGVKNRGAWSHFSDYQGRSRLKRRLNFFARPFLRLFANLFLACTPAAGRWLFGRKRCMIVNNAVDLDRFAFDDSARGRIREQHGIGQAFAMGMMARLVPVKNHQFAFDVFAKGLQRGMNAVFLVIGDGELRGELEAYAKELGIAERVIFTGAVKNPHGYYSALDLLLGPSFHEGLTLVAVEAQAAGLPILVSDTVTRETKISDLVLFKSLQDGANDWAAAAEKLATHKREAVNLADSGFHIKTEAHKLQQILGGTHD
jgi:glycosyltransferase involved in cell wall biosynthesis